MSEYLDKLRSLQIGPKCADSRGSTVQLPKNYAHAKNFTKDGKVCWTTKQEARDIASRARDSGEHVQFDA